MKRTKRKILAVITAFVMLLGCLVVPGGTVSEAASKKLKATCSKKTVAVNCTTTIKTNVKSTFKSSNKKIATVSSKGVVKGKKAGKVKITVTSKSNKNQKKTVNNTVKNQLVVTAPENAKATLEVGKTVKIKTNLSSTYKSSDSEIAEVNKSGTVTAKKAGTAKITVTSKKDKKLKKTVTITVQNKPDPTTEATTTEKQTTEKQTAEKQTTEQQTTEQQTTEQQTTEQPSTEEPKDPVPVGITATYKGKIPDGEFVYEYGMTVNVEYSDKTTKSLGFNDFDYEYVETIEKDGKTYEKYEITYQKLSTDLYVETVKVEDAIYPIGITAEYNGSAIPKDQTPNLDDISVEAEYTNATLKYLSSSDFYVNFGLELDSRVCYWVVYEYGFEYNGEQLYVYGIGSIYVPYE